MPFQIHGESVRDRFEAYVDKGEEEPHPQGCWLWISFRDPNGYGRLHTNGKPILAHRLAWTFYKGPIPPGKYVCHHCDNPSCVNPDHLYIGTQLENMADKSNRGRHRWGVSKGERHGMAKLTESQVLEIRESLGPSEKVGIAYGISGRQVRDIRNRKSWSHLP